ncbi:hypothetical protein PVK06_033936 [Gossypium arboreum]|uniref:Uncharacterized protein n=1 Tax=Gossypium arboreum TaxID=29729 RepID=A0ABR0NEX7_GOSAR|nr:hypothetical protein PVK06_033936 [Gossypium arboreum]
MKPIELKTPPEPTQTITRVIFDILKEHGSLTVVDSWELEVELRGLKSKRAHEDRAEVDEREERLS